jgi:hypothetical protein
VEHLASAADQELAQQTERTACVFQKASRYRILSTLPYTKVTWWTQCVETLKRGALSRFMRRVRMPDVSLPFQILLCAPRYDLVLLTGGQRIDLVYLAMAGLAPWIRTPHVIVDAHWQKASGVAHWLQRAVLRMGRRLTAQVQPHSTEEVCLYHDVFGIPTEVLHPIPYSTSLTGWDVTPASAAEVGDFVLTGGLSFRDYDTLFAAVRQLELKVEVGLPEHRISRRIVRRGRGCPNLRFHTWSNGQFIRKMAACRAFAVPIQPGLTRCTADQTILNAMYFGKVVVATNSIASRVYIQHGVNGFLVPEGSVAGWVETMQQVYGMTDAEYSRIGQHAAYDARVRFNEQLRLTRTLDAALAVLAEP